MIFKPFEEKMKSLKHYLSLIVVVISMNFEKMDAIIEWTEKIGYSSTENCMLNSQKIPFKTIFDVTKELCANNCRTTFGCTYYYWENKEIYDFLIPHYQVCYLRKEIVYKADVIVYNPGFPTSCGVFYQGN